MPLGSQIQAWRISRNLSIEDLALEANLSTRYLEDIEAEELDPPASTLESLATALKIPVTWLFTHPTAFQHLFPEPEEDLPAGSSASDPVTERILTGSRMDRSLYVLLTALIQSAEPKLLRAAEMSLRSLVKQSKQPAVPWENRPSGHFEPPSD